MSSGWWWLVAAGLVEAAWSQTIKPTEGFTRPLPTLVCFMLGVSAVYLLTHAMTSLPVGTAYVVFTALGGFGAVTLGILVHGDPLSGLRGLGLGLVLAGVALCHVADAG
jgi:quaternary ammonium compound-resistance protein SugE